PPPRCPPRPAAWRSRRRGSPRPRHAARTAAPPSPRSAPPNLVSRAEVAVVSERDVAGQGAGGAVDPEVRPGIALVPGDERGYRRESTRDDGCRVAIPRAFVAARLGRAVLGDHDRLAAGIAGVDPGRPAEARVE